MTSVEIVRSGRTWTLTADGHAGFDASGKDIVCAACSAICYAVTSALLDIDANGGCAAISVDFPDQPGGGRCSVSVTPGHGYAERVHGVMLTAINGFQLLSTTYPDYVNISVSNRGSD